MATTLRELSSRVVALADDLARQDPDGAEASVLYEVERGLTTAARRLERLAEGRLR